MVFGSLWVHPGRFVAENEFPVELSYLSNQKFVSFTEFKRYILEKLLVKWHSGNWFIYCSVIILFLIIPREQNLAVCTVISWLWLFISDCAQARHCPDRDLARVLVRQSLLLACLSQPRRLEAWVRGVRLAHRFLACPGLLLAAGGLLAASGVPWLLDHLSLHLRPHVAFSPCGFTRRSFYDTSHTGLGARPPPGWPQLANYSCSDCIYK